MKIFTIGFTKKSAEEFFSLLKQSGIKRLIDIRLNNKSQLAGFTKKGNLKFFLKELIDCEYYHYDFLAPTQEILNNYRKNHNWPQYEKQFIRLLEERQVASQLNRDFFAEKPCCLSFPDYLDGKDFSNFRIQLPENSYISKGLRKANAAKYVIRDRC